MAWLSGWTYRKEVTVSNASADYQTKVLIGKTSDAVGEDVDCGGNIADDFDDLRFTASDGTTLLDYWIELIEDSGGTKLATVWVQNNATPDTTLYMYYSGTETAVSSGSSTFIQYEGFEDFSDGDSLGTDKGTIDWTDSSTGSGVAEGDTAQKYGGSVSGLFQSSDGTDYGYALFDQARSEALAIRFRVRKSEGAYCFIRGMGDGDHYLYIYLESDEDIIYYDGSNNDTGSNIAVDTWELMELNDFDYTNNTYDIILNGTRIQDDATMFASAARVDQFSFIEYHTGSAIWFDDIIIRKWAATEPSFAFGGQETSGWSGEYCGVAVSEFDGVTPSEIDGV